MSLRSMRPETTAFQGPGALPVIAVSLGTLLVVLLSRSSDALSAFFVCLPWAIHFSLSRLRRLAPLKASPSFIIATAYLIFFGSGLISYWINDHTVGLYIVAQVPAEEALRLIACTASVASALVTGDRLVAKDAARLAKVAERPAPLPLLGQLLTLLAISGALTQVAQFGGLQGAVSHFVSHDRTAGQVVSGTLGATLWGLFALPASVSLLLNMIWSGTRGRGRTAFIGAELLFLQGISVVIFGGRLLLVSTLVAGLFQYTWLFRKGPRLVFLGGAAAVLAVLSASVLATRAASQNQFLRGNVFDWFGYSIFDVSIAVQAAASRLTGAFTSIPRALTAFSTVLPGSGSDASAIQQSRLDVIVAQNIGTSAQAASSGLPPSLPTSLWLAGGVVGGIAIGLFLGALAAAVQRILSGSTGYLAGVFVGLWGSFVFNALKSGDLPLDAGTEISRWIYVAVLAALLSVIIPTGKSDGDARIGRPLHHPRVPGKNADVR